MKTIEKYYQRNCRFLFFIPFILSHQIFRNQISEHRFRKIGQSQLLNQSIFGLVLSDNKLTASPIYACIQMEVAFVSLLYANISTTFAIYLKRRRTVVFILQPPWNEISIDSWLYGTGKLWRDYFLTFCIFLENDARSRLQSGADSPIPLSSHINVFSLKSLKVSLFADKLLIHNDLQKWYFQICLQRSVIEVSWFP